MINSPALQPPEFRGFRRGVCLYRLEPPRGFPEVDSLLARMFRVDPGEFVAALAGIPGAEQEALLHSLAGAITRVNYHRERFDFILREIDERRRRIGLNRGGDRFGRAAVYEAASMLAAARSIVDEVVYIAARRAGKVEADADEWSAHGLVNQPEAQVLAKGRLVPEARLLRARATWFNQLGEYRNALTHRGSIAVGGFGYYPPGDPSPEAADPMMNLFVVPDQPSIARPARPDRWRYTAGGRLEDLVRDMWRGLEDFMMDVGQEWGQALPMPGTADADAPNVVVSLPLLNPFATANSTPIVAVFTTEVLAREFLNSVPDANLEPVEVRLCYLGPPRWLLWIPPGSAWEPLRDRSVSLAVDPRDVPGAGIVPARVLGDVAVQSIVSSAVGWFIDIPAQDLPDSKAIYVLAPPR